MPIFPLVLKCHFIYLEPFNIRSSWLKIILCAGSALWHMEGARLITLTFRVVNSWLKSYSQTDCSPWEVCVACVYKWKTNNNLVAMDKYCKIWSIFLLQLLKYLFFIWLFQSMILTLSPWQHLSKQSFFGILVQRVTPPSLPTCPLITTCHKRVCESE